MATKKILDRFLEVTVNPILIPGIFKEREECQQLERLFRFHDEVVEYQFLLQTSGYAAIFHYHPKKFWVYDLSTAPTIPSALNAVGYDFNQNHPATLDDAFNHIKESIDADKPVYMFWYEPIVVYGYDYSGPEKKVHWYNKPFGSKGVTWTEKEIEKLWWGQEFFRFQLTLGAPMEKPGIAKVFDLCVRYTVKMATEDPVKSAPQCEDVSSGFEAYESYANDLKNMDLRLQINDQDTDFGIARGWGCFAIYPQWTARMATALFLKEYSSFASPDHKTHIDQAVSCYEQEIVAWLRWQECLGRNWKLMTPDNVKAHNEDYNNRWADEKIRARGSEAVMVALELEKRAINELKQYTEKVAPVEDPPEKSPKKKK